MLFSFSGPRFSPFYWLLTFRFGPSISPFYWFIVVVVRSCGVIVVLVTCFALRFPAPFIITIPSHHLPITTPAVDVSLTTVLRHRPPDHLLLLHHLLLLLLRLLLLLLR